MQWVYNRLINAMDINKLINEMDIYYRLINDHLIYYLFSPFPL